MVISLDQERTFLAEGGSKFLRSGPGGDGSKMSMCGISGACLYNRDINLVFRCFVICWSGCSLGGDVWVRHSSRDGDVFEAAGAPDRRELGILSAFWT